MIDLKCNYCGKIFKGNFRADRPNSKRFCSKDCSNKYKYKQNDIAIKEDYAVMNVDGIETLIDVEDIDRVNQVKWCARYDKSVDGYYFKGHERNNYANRKNFALHRYIMNTPEDEQCDHINRNTLDNRKCNLRNVDNLTNADNKGFYSNNTTGFKNIYYNKINKTYVCEIKRHKKMIFRKCCRSLEKLVKLRDEFLSKKKGGDL